MENISNKVSGIIKREFGYYGLYEKHEGFLSRYLGFQSKSEKEWQKKLKEFSELHKGKEAVYEETLKLKEPEVKT